MSVKWKSILLTVIIVLLGFIRGYLFGNINWVYKTLTEGRMNQARDEFHFLLDWDPSNIVILKWVLTIIFIGLFSLLSYLIIKIYFKNPTYSRITLLLFAGIFLGSGLLLTIGKLFGISNDIYHIVRTLMGLGQSFMPLMILFILFKFFPQTKAE
ncbi:MAG: hypothetical protein ABJG68_05610 [Crocinitomicaceae bacterium]